MPNVVLAVVKVDGEPCEHVNERCRNDGQVALMSAKQCGGVLRFARRMSMLNLEIVLRAVEEDGTALELVSEKLRQNRDIELAAVPREPTRPWAIRLWQREGLLIVRQRFKLACHYQKCLFRNM